MAGNSGPSVDELVEAGNYGEAARAATAAGDHARAADLYERIWDFAGACASARAAGDYARALKNAVDARDEASIDELTRTLCERGDDGKTEALEVLAAHRRYGAAARLAVELDRRDRAIELYTAGHFDLDAARLLVDAGRDRDAGRLLERVVEQGDFGEDYAEAQLLLGRLLAGRMQHEAAVRHLQEAAQRAPTRAEARALLIVELAAMGLRDGARDVLVAARADDPSLPATLDEFLGSARKQLPAPSRSEVEIVGGRYRLERLLGSGGSGRVSLARDEVSGRAVAIKMFNAYARGNEAYERFVREAQIATSLHHANLVEVYTFSADQGYLVMEYMVGGSLADRIPRGLGSGAVIRMAVDILGGLELAHQRGVIHRDVKPANIFFDARGTAKLGDFGVAHLLDLGQTQTGGLIGTLAYMSPEQITGARLTIATDLYALGVTLFEALTGRLPLQGPDFVAQHLGETPPAPSQVADVPEAWDPIIGRLLAKDPAERYESIADLRRDIMSLKLAASEAPKPLLLPRAMPLSQPPPTGEERPPESPEPRDTLQGQRYQFETRLGTTDNSTLSRALDTALDRSVIIERYREPPLDETSERRLFALAQGGAFVQRALSYDRGEGLAVFEAPAGRSFSEVAADAPLPQRRVARLLKRLARAVEPVHRRGAAHGDIGDSTVVLDDSLNPTVMASGLGPAAPEASPADDIAQLFALTAQLLDLPDGDPHTLIASLLPTSDDAERRAILAAGPPVTGEQLYAFADALEIALLKAELL